MKKIIVYVVIGFVIGAVYGAQNKQSVQNNIDIVLKHLENFDISDYMAHK